MVEAGTRHNMQVVHEQAAKYASDAWRILQGCARKLASAHGIKPEELMLSEHYSTLL